MRVGWGEGRGGATSWAIATTSGRSLRSANGCSTGLPRKQTMVLTIGNLTPSCECLNSSFAANAKQGKRPSLTSAVGRRLITQLIQKRTSNVIEFSGSSRRDSPPTVACNALLAAHRNSTTPAAGGPPQKHHTSSSEFYPCSWRPTPTAPHQLIRILPLQMDVKAVSLCFVCAPCRQQRGDFCVEDQTSSHKAILAVSIVVEVIAAEMSRSPFRSSCLIGIRQGAVTPRPTVSIPSRMTVLKGNAGSHQMPAIRWQQARASRFWFAMTGLLEQPNQQVYTVAPNLGRHGAPLQRLRTTDIARCSVGRSMV